ncbi:Protein of unknown function [Leuconostoc citreum LBAE C11]|nr:Protein of unknown function [Leuconostoc citreum LBAE C11]
MISLFQK